MTPQFDGVSPFAENLAAIRRLGQRWSYIDVKGNTVIPAKYESAGRFSEGLAAVELKVGNGYRWGFIDSTGKQVIEPKFYKARFFSEGLAGVQAESGRWGYIDKTGSW